MDPADGRTITTNIPQELFEEVWGGEHRRDGVRGGPSNQQGSRLPILAQPGQICFYMLYILMFQLGSCLKEYNSAGK